jgi:hypothetical protein
MVQAGHGHGGLCAVIPALRSWRQEDLEFKANLSFILRPSQKKAKKAWSNFMPSPRGLL